MSADPAERAPDWQIDLHGCNVDQAITRTRFAVQTCRHLRYELLLAITGRGRGNPRQEAVLAPAVLEWARTDEARALGVQGARLVSKGGAVELEISGGARY